MSNRTRTLLLAVAVAAALLNIGASTDPVPGTLGQIVEAERSFARMCGEKGLQQSFYQFFSDDVVTFEPAIEVGKENLKTPNPNFDHIILEWQPQTGDVAAAGDIGWLTGPSINSDRKGEWPTRHGQYLSVWKKTASGDWRVVMDVGIRTPSAPSALNEPFKPWDAQSPKVIRASAQKSDLTKVESEFASDMRELGSQRAICERAAENIRVHRMGVLPLLGKVSACDYLKAHDHKADSKTVGAFVSASDDLGYSYGYYKIDGDTPRAYFSRIWKKDSRGNWRIAADTALPAEQKQQK